MDECLVKITEAIKTDDLANAVEILKTNVSADIVNEALFCACRDGKPRFVELFLEAGADVNYTRLFDSEHDNITGPLLIACVYGVSEDYTQVVRILLEYGADVHFQNDGCLLCECWNDDVETVRLLLDYGADIRADDGDTMWDASLRENDDIVKLLLDYGADKKWLYPEASPEMREYIPVNPRRVRLGMEN